MDDSAIINYVLSARDEAKSARKTRDDLTRDNYDQFHLKHDFSHKRAGQSKEVLAKQKMATIQASSFFQQALADLGDWWKCEPADGTDGTGKLIRPHELYALAKLKLEQADYYSHVGRSTQAALLGSLSITKVHGCLKPKPKFVARKKGRGAKLERWVEKSEDKTWHLKFDLIEHENYYPDPTGSGLYEIEESFLDLHLVRALAEEPYAIYEKAKLKEIEPWGGASTKEEQDRARKTGQDARTNSFRPQVKITEFWGSVIDQETGEMLHENCVITLANDRILLRKPTANPLWHQSTPIVAAALLEVGNSVWGTALMDAGTKLNRAQTEIYNLMLDASLQAVHNITQIRIDDLDDPKQIANGIPAGTTLKVRNSLPPGAKVYEPVSTGQVPPDVLNLYQLTGEEGNTSMLTNDIRSGGGMGAKNVRATAVVEASNTITSVFQGLAKNIELKKIKPELELAVLTIAQNWDLIAKDEFVALFGEERGEQLSQLPAEEVFVAVAEGFKFHVFGISQKLTQEMDFRKWTTLLQTIGASEVLIEAFIQRFPGGFPKMLEGILRSLGLDVAKLEENPSAAPAPAMPPPPQEMQAPGAAPGATPNQMSQVPQAPQGPSGLAAVLAGGQNFPGSRALANQGGN